VPPRLAAPRLSDQRTLTAAQAARRRRIVAAATELAARGYDHCHMRAVAAAAGVAASTVYLYFPSKDDLLLACLRQWLCDLEMAPAPHRIDLDPHAGLLAVAARLTGELARVPRLADAMVRPYLYACGGAAEGADAVRGQVTGMFLDGTGVDHSETYRPLAELFTDVCMTNVPAIAQRRTSVGQLMQRLARAATVIADVDPHRLPATTTGRPTLVS
jgi:TetR/AcrR family transcriptional regulator, cholesterol catabolism regulator